MRYIPPVFGRNRIVLDKHHDQPNGVGDLRLGIGGKRVVGPPSIPSAIYKSRVGHNGHVFGDGRRRQPQEIDELTDAELSVAKSRQRANPERMIYRLADSYGSSNATGPSL